MVTVEMVQALLNEMGGAREKSAPVADICYGTSEVTNVMSALDADGDFLAHIAYRPHDIGKPGHDKHGLLFV